MVGVPECRQQVERGLRSLLVSCTDRCGRPAQISEPQCRLLLALSDAGGHLSKRAATRALLGHPVGVLSDVERASASRGIRRLERAGFVSRAADGVRLTPKAVGLLDWAHHHAGRVSAGRRGAGH